MEPAEYRLMDQAEAGMWWYRALHARIADALRATHGRVLDAGCGTGGLLARLRANPALDLHGLEYEAEAAHRAAQKSGARIVREEEAERLARQHRFIDRGDLVRERIDEVLNGLNLRSDYWRSN